ncbi:MAG: nicotinate (nicotinamide) nucleotide adenylyltransferase [Armatimonadetes bacterium]|nr:nicotinate (nicotinamide) nucleotide adenylyltransferase [Armatimonadota bacterium]
MRRGVLGGTFNPIHNGHLRLAVEALEQLSLNEVVLEVAVASPFKTEEQSADAALRFEMVCAAVESTPGLRAGRTDLDRGPPSYTVVTLAAHSAGDRELWFILGSDSLRSFPNWRDPDGIVRLARLAAGERPGCKRGEALDLLRTEWRDRVDWFEMPLLDVSSSAVRRRVADGRCIRHLTPESVVRMIERERLYRGGP